MPYFVELVLSTRGVICSQSKCMGPLSSVRPGGPTAVSEQLLSSSSLVQTDAHVDPFLYELVEFVLGDLVGGVIGVLLLYPGE